MANAFTKKYLTELIDERLKKLKEPDGSWTEDEKRLVKMIREDAEWQARDVLTRAAKLITRLEEALATHDAEPTVHSQRELIGATSALSYMRQHDSPHIAEVRELQSRINKVRMSNPSNPDAETSRLERVKKYITDSPEDEFSFTLMRSLGFIDIIKKAING